MVVVMVVAGGPKGAWDVLVVAAGARAAPRGGLISVSVLGSVCVEAQRAEGEGGWADRLVALRLLQAARLGSICERSRIENGVEVPLGASAVGDGAGQRVLPV